MSVSRGDLMVLAHLKTVSAQRLVLQHAAPRSVFWRTPLDGLCPRVGLRQINRLRREGWLSEAAHGYSTFQDELVLTPAAHARFVTKADWKAALRLYREVADSLAPERFAEVVDG